MAVPEGPPEYQLSSEDVELLIGGMVKLSKDVLELNKDFRKVERGADKLSHQMDALDLERNMAERMSRSTHGTAPTYPDIPGTSAYDPFLAASGQPRSRTTASSLRRLQHHGMTDTTIGDPEAFLRQPMPEAGELSQQDTASFRASQSTLPNTEGSFPQDPDVLTQHTSHTSSGLDLIQELGPLQEMRGTDQRTLDELRASHSRGRKRNESSRRQESARALARTEGEAAERPRSGLVTTIVAEKERRQREEREQQDERSRQQELRQLAKRSLAKRSSTRQGEHRPRSKSPTKSPRRDPSSRRATFEKSPNLTSYRSPERHRARTPARSSRSRQRTVRPQSPLVSRSTATRQRSTPGSTRTRQREATASPTRQPTTVTLDTSPASTESQGPGFDDLFAGDYEIPTLSPTHPLDQDDNPSSDDNAEPTEAPKAMDQGRKRPRPSVKRGTSRKRGRSTPVRSTKATSRSRTRESSMERDVETERDQRSDREERTLSAGRGSTRGRAKSTRPVGRPKKLQKEKEVPKDPVDVDAFCGKIRWPSLTETQKEVIRADRVREATLEKTPPKPRKSMRNVGAVEEQTEETEAEQRKRSRREDRKAFQARHDQETLSIHPFAELDQDVQNVIKDAIQGLDTSEDIMSRLGNAPCKSKDVGICVLEKEVSKGKRMVQELGLSCTACHKFPLPRPCLSGREDEDGGLLMVPTGRTVDVADPKCWL
ncbi:hypothetical protein IWZ03DRAFT_414191 [Phyllosticta citriasiana]|uniref:Uncharacterized protein n=1 Tax=Phyllosticta citriasiana TaxID=595635 RepID=A0ABR1KR77_9PEZI